MTELMNLEMVLPAPLNPPFPERHAMDALGRVHFIGIGGAGMSAITPSWPLPARRAFRFCTAPRRWPP